MIMYYGNAKVILSVPFHQMNHLFLDCLAFPLKKVYMKQNNIIFYYHLSLQCLRLLLFHPCFLCFLSLHQFPLINTTINICYAKQCAKNRLEFQESLFSLFCLEGHSLQFVPIIRIYPEAFCFFCLIPFHPLIQQYLEAQLSPILQMVPNKRYDQVTSL